MTWFKVDDQVAFCPKHVQAGNEAVGAWVRAGSWSAQQLTDGFIPTEVAHSIAPKKVWMRLVEARGRSEHGLVELRQDGYQLHDYLKYNESSSKVKAKREAWAIRQGKARGSEVSDSEHLSKMSRSDTPRDYGRDSIVESPRDSTSPDPDPDPFQPDTSERGSETSMPPCPPTARGGTGRQSDPGTVRPVIDAEWLYAALVQRVFLPLREGGFLDDLAGRLATTGVLSGDVLEAAEDFALKRTGDGLAGEALVRAFAGYVGQAKRRRQAVAAKDGPLDEEGRIAMTIWCELWARAHGGAAYPVCARDNGYIRTIAARARSRAAHFGGRVRGRDVVRHYFTRYLALDDKALVKKRYPLALLESQLPAIGEFEEPRQKPPAAPPSSSRALEEPVHKAELPDLSAMFQQEQAKTGGRLVARARA